MAASTTKGVAVGRWRPRSSEGSAVTDELAQQGELGHHRSCSASLSSALGRGISNLNHRHALAGSHRTARAASPAEFAAATAAKGNGGSGRELWGDIFFGFRALAALDEPPALGASGSCKRRRHAAQDSDGELEEHQPFAYGVINSKCYGKPSPYADGMLRLHGGQPPLNLAAGAACGGLLIGLHVALLAGLGHSAPQLIGGVSSICALGGTASCLLSLRGQPSSDLVEMPPWMTISFSALCSALAPLALVPLSPAALLSVAGPIRLALPGSVGALVMFEVTHRCWAHIDPSRVASLGGTRETFEVLNESQSANMIPRVLRIWWRHFSPWVANRGVGAVYFLGNLAVTYFAVHIDLSMTQWKNGFFNALQASDSVGFYHQLWDFAPIALASSMATIYSGYLATMWDLRWREELTLDFVHMFLKDKAYYLVRFAQTGRAGGIDNFDQRLVDDTAIFASSSRGLMCGFAEALLRFIVFFPALVRLSPTPMVWQFCIALSVISSALTHIVGKPLAAQNAQLQRTEADFRSSLMRLRIFAEDIALQGGEGAEGASAARYFESVKAATWMAARATLNLVTYTSAYGLAGGILPLLVLVPSFFSGQITLGTMFQIEALVGGVRSSLDFFIGAYGDIAAWRAATDRLLALEDIHVDGPFSTPPEAAPRARMSLPSSADAGDDEDESLEAENLVIAANNSEHTILQNVSFCWRGGERIVILGPSGCGKTAFLRTLAGAWPPPVSGFASSLGANSTAGVQTMLVTSKGFLLPVQTSLRKCLAYPEAIAAFDEDLKEALTVCGLEHLVEKLGVEADWAADLSAGDRQRLVFARLIARWPMGVQWLFLDDVAAGLPEATATELHTKLASKMPNGTGLVVVSRHSEVQRQRDWRRFRIDPQRQALVEDFEGGLNLCGTGTLVESEDMQGEKLALAATGESPETPLLGDARMAQD